MSYRRLFAALLLAVAIGTGWSAHSARAQPLPVLRLPFPAGSSWKAIQGYNGGTHVPGPERYALDLVRDDGATGGADVIAPVSGTLWFMNSPGSGNGCLSIKMDGNSGLIVQMCHFFARPFRTDERITIGQPIGTIGPIGTVGNNGTAHLHLSMHRTPDLGYTRIPVPFAYPEGIPLEGIAMPPDGSYNQYGCPSASCKGVITSTNGMGSPAIPVAGAPVTSAPAAPAALPAAAGPALVTLPAGAPPMTLRVGVVVRVSGDGDCVNARSAPGMAGRVQTCLPDGTVSAIAQGPVPADGRVWWQLAGLGWAAGDLLTGVMLAGGQIQTGTAVVVDAGANDCLNLRDAASMAATIQTCIPSGARLTVTDGPREAEGHTWWQLEGRGWAVADYLRARDGA